MASCNCTAVCSIFLTLFSIGYFLLGLAIFAIACVVYFIPGLLNVTEYLNFDFVVVLLFMIAGVLLVLSAIFGCVISCKRPFCLIITFIVFILVAVGLQVGAIFKIKGSVEMGLNISHIDPVVNFQRPMQNYWSGKINVDDKVDQVQSVFGCCGYVGYKDWKTVPKNEEEMKKKGTIDGYIPKSCCRNEKNCTTTLGIHKTGCDKEITNHNYFNRMFSVAFTSGPSGSLIYQLVGVVIAIILAVLVRKERGDDRGQFIPMSNQTSL